MDRNSILIATITLLVGFIGGFLLANSINRSEINSIRSQSSMPSNADTGKPGDTKLTAEEIQAKVAEADANPTNVAFQKELGIGLYRYGVAEQDLNVLADAARLLERANSLDAKDLDVLVNLGNAYFDIGYARKEMASFGKARDAYGKALAIAPKDANVRTDLGISYYVQPEPDYAKAVAELQKVVADNPRHDRSMQFLAQVLVEQGKITDAEKLIARIKEIDPKNPAIGQLTSQIERANNSGK